MAGVGPRAPSTRHRSARSAPPYWEYVVHGSHFSQGSVGGMLGASMRGEVVSACGEEGSTGGEATRVGGSSSSSSAGNIWASVWSGSNTGSRSGFAAQEPFGAGGPTMAGR